MKPITKKQFRTLLTLSILASIAAVMAAALANRWLLPQPLLDYRVTEHAGPPKLQDIVVGILALPGAFGIVLAVIGLYQIRPGAPRLAAASWAYMLIWMAISPWPIIENPVAGAFSQCSTLLAGIVLGVIYFSPAAEWFQRGCPPPLPEQTNQRQPPGAEVQRKRRLSILDFSSSAP